MNIKINFSPFTMLARICNPSVYVTSLAILFIITGCIKEVQPDCVEETIIVSVAPDNIQLSYLAHNPASVNLTVSCLDLDGQPENTFPWTLSMPETVDTWLELTLDPNGQTGKGTSVTGTGLQSVYLVAKENTTAQIRTMELSMDEGETVAVTVTQGFMSLTVSPAAITLTGTPYNPAGQTVSVSSNQSWTLTSNQQWLQLTLNANGSGASTTINGNGSQTVYLVVAGNGDDVREADIYLNGVATDVRAHVVQESLTIEQGQAAPRIFISGSGGDMKLMLTRKPTNYGAYFQFGSIIGWNWDDVNATYNPTRVANLAYWNPAWNNGNKAVAHSHSELSQGRGDPCRLTGYTVDDIKAAIDNGRTLDNTQWRLPTYTENIAYGQQSSGWTSVEGVEGMSFTAGNEFLPAAGRKIAETGVYAQRGNRSNYAGSSIDVDSRAPFSLFFNNQSVFVSDIRDGQAQGYSIRCVRQ